MIFLPIIAIVARGALTGVAVKKTIDKIEDEEYKRGMSRAAREYEPIVDYIKLFNSMIKKDTIEMKEEANNIKSLIKKYSSEKKELILQREHLREELLSRENINFINSAGMLGMSGGLTFNISGWSLAYKKGYQKGKIIWGEKIQEEIKKGKTILNNYCVTKEKFDLAKQKEPVITEKLLKEIADLKMEIAELKIQLAGE